MSDPTPDPAANPGGDPTPGPVEPHPSIWRPLDGSGPLEPEPASIWQPLDGSPPAEPAAQFRQPDAGLRVPDAPPAAWEPGRPVYVLSNWWPRAGALVIDNILLGFVTLMVLFPIGLLAGMTANESADFFSYSGAPPERLGHEAFFYALLVVGYLFQALLPAVFLVLWKGQTPGKRITGIRVVRADGEAMNWRTALVRETLGRAILLPIITVVTLGIGLLLNYLWPLWDAQHRAGIDFLADTRVVRAK